MGIDGKLSRHLPAKTVKILLDNHVLTGNAQPEAIVELALQHGTLILPQRGNEPGPNDGATASR